MGSTQHTPGPWGSYNLTPGSRAVETREGRRIADVVGIDFEADANARLIAAAPDLLAALCEVETVPSLKDGAEPLLAAVRAAIAKAEGR